MSDTPESGSLLPEIQPEEKIDLTPYQQYIRHDRYQNRITVSGTRLITDFTKAAPYMEEIHRKQMQQVDQRLLETSGRLSRTQHHQLAAIVNRYLPRIKTENEQLATTLQAAIQEASYIEKLSSQQADEVTLSRRSGNIRFVDSLTGKKS